MSEAAKLGFNENRSEWSNLGQGAPETGPLKGGPARLKNISISDDAYEYAPVGGLSELRKAVAKMYNDRYRVGKKSQYTEENVAIGSGGRLALTRVASTLGVSHIGHFLPDYTAYEELLGTFGTFVPIPISLPIKENYNFSANDLEKEILSKGLSAVLISNPSNPTGNVIHGEALKNWVSLSRELECATIFDEFYSNYIYDLDKVSISAAEYVEDVNKDPIIILDGLTKNWRYPGLRISWTLGPKELIDACISAGSFLDGGANHPTQEAVIPLVSKEIADQEAAAIKNEFLVKREYLVKALGDMGIIANAPKGAFYCWGDLSNLKNGNSSGKKLFERAVQNKIIIVPGEFFDINPGKRRPKKAALFDKYARFSFGPPMKELELGVKLLREVL